VGPAACLALAIVGLRALLFSQPLLTHSLSPSFPPLLFSFCSCPGFSFRRGLPADFFFLLTCLFSTTRQQSTPPTQSSKQREDRGRCSVCGVGGIWTVFLPSGRSPETYGDADRKSSGQTEKTKGLARREKADRMKGRTKKKKNEANPAASRWQHVSRGARERTTTRSRERERGTFFLSTSRSWVPFSSPPLLIFP